MPKYLEINVHQPRNGNMGSSFEVLLDILQRINNLNPDDHITFNFKSLSFVFPFLILPLSALIKYFRKKGVIIKIIPSTECDEYLKTIHFPEGFNPISLQNWESELNSYCKKTYLPVCFVPAQSSDSAIRDRLLSTLEQIIQNQLNFNNQLHTSISYLISEAFDNIVEHSGADNGWIMIQNYPLKEFLDVCIVDTGIGILGSYRRINFPDITSHDKALQEAINGRSTKIEEKSRGYGIRTSRYMLVHGLGGKYFIFSGNAFYIWTTEQEQINVLRTNFIWNGTMLALRIPKVTPKGFNYINYVG